MLEHPLISVSVIIYNQREFLKECVDSILAQDYENIEIVLADDGSTDGTQDLIQNYACKHPDKIIPLTDGPNLGITGNSNRALSACRGKYIAFMGGDDLMLPGKISAQVEFMEQHPKCGICYHDLDVFQSESGETLRKFSELNTPKEGGAKTAVQYGTFNGGSSTMIRSSAAPVEGFDNRIPIASDWLFWVDVLSGGYTINYIDQVFGRYRRHAGNVTGSVRSVAIKNMQDLLMSCGIILSKYPDLADQVRRRQGALLRSLRWSHDGQLYNKFILASLVFSWRPKTLVGLVMGWFGVKR